MKVDLDKLERDMGKVNLLRATGDVVTSNNLRDRLDQVISELREYREADKGKEGV